MAKKVIKISSFVVIIFLLSYFTYMAFQGVNTSIVSYVKEFWPYFGSLVNVFLLPAFAVFLYRLFFSPQNSRRFNLKNGYYLAVVSLIALGGMIYSAAIYTNWFIGITWLYPIDFIVIDVVILVMGVITILKGYKMEKEEKKPVNVKQGFIIALMYIYIFICLDRFGAFESSIINGPGRGILMLLPLYLSLISPMVLAIGFMVNKVQAPEEHIPSKSFCTCAFTSLGMALVGFIFCVVFVFGPDASDYMRIASPFFALDRLASLPILITLLTVLSVAIPLAFSIHIVRFFAKQKKAKQE